MAKAKSVNWYLSELIQAYQMYTAKTCTEMALDFGVTLSNLYLYRVGRGNPTAKTVDRIVGEIERQCPAAFEQVKILQWEEREGQGEQTQ